ncbi:hypothetical protein SAMN02745166_02603 [Prosthecobacter debontii]|uniref:Uncharacterized protein n=1 Tax=Prosthecobacter debontii TaxID=48467 RepID=A0A1T4Y6K3_9BACT|nr:hypothetical protein SAMN02745166_02603 [Prosthecobacter debontii]
MARQPVARYSNIEMSDVADREALAGQSVGSSWSARVLARCQWRLATDRSPSCIITPSWVLSRPSKENAALQNGFPRGRVKQQARTPALQVLRRARACGSSTIGVIHSARCKPFLQVETSLPTHLASRAGFDKLAHVGCIFFRDHDLVRIDPHNERIVFRLKVDDPIVTGA